MLVARRSRCPSNKWKTAQFAGALLQHARPSPSSPLVYVNAGANKGFAVAEFLQRFQADGGNAPSNARWHKSIRAIKPSGMFSCGMCGACKDPLPPPAEQFNTSVTVVALELLKGNHWLLSQLFARHGVPGVALNVAASNYTGVAYAPTGVRTGQEWSSAELAHGDAAARARKLRLTTVPSLTMDALAAQRCLETIHWLSIDAEGWDGLIVEGSERLLSARRVSLLEFEYHSKGMWARERPDADRRDLKRVLRRLHEHGYTCFWQGDAGDLAQASGDRWCDDFEWRPHALARVMARQTTSLQ